MFYELLIINIPQVKRIQTWAQWPDTFSIYCIVGAELWRWGQEPDTNIYKYSRISLKLPDARKKSLGWTSLTWKIWGRFGEMGWDCAGQRRRPLCSPSNRKGQDKVKVFPSYPPSRLPSITYTWPRNTREFMSPPFTWPRADSSKFSDFRVHVNEQIKTR